MRLFWRFEWLSLDGTRGGDRRDPVVGRAAGSRRRTRIWRGAAAREPLSGFGRFVQFGRDDEAFRSDAAFALELALDGDLTDQPRRD